MDIQHGTMTEAIHIDIQPYIVQGVKHYRAKKTSDSDDRYIYETVAGETLDQFRCRIMNILNTGIITHFKEEWNWNTIGV